jgi:hypothetical protein
VTGNIEERFGGLDWDRTGDLIVANLESTILTRLIGSLYEMFACWQEAFQIVRRKAVDCSK